MATAIQTEKELSEGTAQGTKENPAPKQPEHDPGHGRWILDPITGEKRNNNED